MEIDVDPEQDFHVVINGAATALSLDALAEAYEADLISDETLIWQQGLDEWMRLDTLLAALGGPEDAQEQAPLAPEPVVTPNAYSVAVAPGDIRSLTLQALADAHRAGVIQQQTLVCAPGSSEWVPLSVIIAGFSAPQANPAPASTPASLAPTSIAPAPQSTSAQSAPAAPSAPSMSAAPAAYPSAPNSLAPTAASIGPTHRNGGASVAPQLDLGDLDLQTFQNSKSPWILRSLMGAGALGFAFVIYASMGDSGADTAKAPAVSANTTSAAAIPEVEATPSAWEQEQAMLEEADRLDEAAKAQANAFGASLAGESKPKPAATAPATRKWQPKAKKTTSKSAGHSEYDPMNGTL